MVESLSESFDRAPLDSVIPMLRAADMIENENKWFREDCLFSHNSLEHRIKVLLYVLVSMAKGRQTWTGLKV
jgi:hypothetical protein